MLLETSKYLLGLLFFKTGQYAYFVNRFILRKEVSVNLIGKLHQIDLEMKVFIVLEFFRVKITIEMVELKTFRLNRFVVESNQLLLCLFVMCFVD